MHLNFQLFRKKKLKTKKQNNPGKSLLDSSGLGRCEQLQAADTSDSLTSAQDIQLAGT